MSQTFEKRTSCKATSHPQTNRKVSISSLSQNLNDIVCVEHLFWVMFGFFMPWS